MSVLVDENIERLVETKQLIEEFEKDCLQGASYDMRIGVEYMKRGEVQRFTEERPSIIMEPGEFIILTTHESLNMPNNLVGHNGIQSTWAKRGIVSLFSPQIDPGFCGILIVPLFNAGDTPVSMRFKQPVFTVEFVLTKEPASYGWSEKHGNQERIWPGIAPFITRPSLADLLEMKQKLSKAVDDLAILKESHKSFSTYVNNIIFGLLIALVVAVIGGLVYSILTTAALKSIDYLIKYLQTILSGVHVMFLC